MKLISILKSSISSSLALSEERQHRYKMHFCLISVQLFNSVLRMFFSPCFREVFALYFCVSDLCVRHKWESEFSVMKIRVCVFESFFGSQI